MISASVAEAQSVTFVQKLTTDPVDKPWPGGVIYKRFVVSGAPTAARAYVYLDYSDPSLGEAGAQPVSVSGNGSYLAEISVTGSYYASGEAKAVILTFMFTTLAISDSNEYSGFTIISNPNGAFRRPRSFSRKGTAQVPQASPGSTAKRRAARSR